MKPLPELTIVSVKAEIKDCEARLDHTEQWLEHDSARKRLAYAKLALIYLENKDKQS